MDTFLKALPITATSPTAYAAYITTVIAWLLIAWRVRRYKVLLDHIESLPARDRLTAVKAEMGFVQIKGGVTAEQWLRSRVHTFYLVGFCVVCITILAVTALAVFGHSGSVNGSIGLEQ